MSEVGMTIDQLRAEIGQSTDPFVVTMDKKTLVRCAKSIDDPNPVYVDEEYAKNSRYGGLIGHWTSLWHAYFLTREARPVIRKVGKTSFHGGDEYEFFEPIRAGDTLICTTKLVDVFERQGKLGKMVFITDEVTFWNQESRKVATVRRTAIQI